MMPPLRGLQGDGFAGAVIVLWQLYFVAVIMSR